MNTTKLEESKIVSKDDDDFPFVLCTPTKNGIDEVDAQDSMLPEDESPRLMNFFLKPRRSCKCPTRCHHEQNDMSTDSALNDMANDSDSAKEHILERNPPSQQFTPSSSPVPALQSFDVMVTPPVINLLKRRRRPSQDEHKEGKDGGDDNSPSKMCPLFPSLGRQQQQQPHQRLPVLHRPVARRLR